MLAAATRLVALGRPGVLVFDETYYVKDAYTLGEVGSERDWPEDANLEFEAGNLDVYLDLGSYVVHPPFGKWLIWLGAQPFGFENSFGWRFATAIAGTLTVLLVILIARRLTGSVWFGNLAGLFVALEGQSIVLSRTAILDGLLTFLVVLGLYLLVLADRNWLATIGRLGRVPLRLQPLLLPVGIVLGLATAVKWSGLYLLAAFGLYSFFSDLRARYRYGQNPLASLPQGFLNAVALLIPAAASYLFSWLGWILGSDGWGRQARGSWWESLWAYHQNAFAFHTGLASEHPYEANAFEWLLSLRPTAFFFERFEQDEICAGLGNCTVAITAIPNLVVWFAGLGASLWLAARFLRSSRASTLVLLGLISSWLPWVIFIERTTFQFYAVLMVPFVVLALVLALHHYWRRSFLLRNTALRERRILLLALGTVVCAAYFMSIWMGLPTPDWVWRIQMLLPIWI